MYISYFWQSFGAKFSFLWIWQFYQQQFTFCSHWCYHPSQSLLNLTELEDWKNCFLPIEASAEGGLAPSSCKIYLPPMYQVSWGRFHITFYDRNLQKNVLSCPVWIMKNIFLFFKWYSLLRFSVNYCRKKIYEIEPWF